MDPYISQVYRSLPRILGLYDTDITNPSYGLGDRFYWAWKLIDFPNATYQGVTHGLALLLSYDLLPKTFSKKYILGLIDSVFLGTKSILRNNGSLEEAFPYESSFCVTALVAYDQLNTINILKDFISKEKISNYLTIIKPLIQFLKKSKESHGFISNHLATAAAALYKWDILTGDHSSNLKANVILDSIISHQSNEGWYLEYEGADPGYQSLCMHYLADIYSLTKCSKLKISLEKSIDFLSHFVHPDGSFGGIYGSRNTRFYYPGGITSLAKYFSQANDIAIAMSISIDQGHTITLDAIDEPNLIPMFNSYCIAATSMGLSFPTDKKFSLPWNRTTNFRTLYKKAGLLIDKGNEHYTIISIFKGGVCYHFENNKLTNKNLGKIFLNRKNKYLSTQVYNDCIQFTLNTNQLEIYGRLIKIHKHLLSPIKMVLLRIGNLTFLRCTIFREFIKKILVKYLITRKPYSKFTFSRKILLGAKLSISDSIYPNQNQLQDQGDNSVNFSVIHMASQGYWQAQDAQK